jgi:hypothetical protein
MSQKSVQLSTIRQWEHQMYRWMDAYRVDMGTIYTQKQARIFGCMKYKSHRRNITIFTSNHQFVPPSTKT